VMRIRLAKFSPVPSDLHLAHNTLPGDPSEGKVGELRGYVGESAKVERGRENPPCGGDRDASCFTPSRGLSRAVVSDSMLNEARDGFLT